MSSNLQLGKTSTVHLAVSSTGLLITVCLFFEQFRTYWSYDIDTEGSQCGCHCLGCHGNRSSDAPCTCKVKWLPGAQPMDAAVGWRLHLRDEWIIVRNGKNVDSETLRSMGQSMNKLGMAMKFQGALALLHKWWTWNWLNEGSTFAPRN